MALPGSALCCTHIAADAWFLGKGRTRRENRESTIIVSRGNGRHNRDQRILDKLLRLLRSFLSTLFSSQLLEEQADGLNPVVEVWDMKLLVGSVEIVVREAESHHHAWDLQAILKVGDDRDRSAAANEDGFFLEGVVQRFSRGLDVRIVGPHYAGRTLAVNFNFRIDALRRELLHEVRVLLKNVVGILIGH